MNRIMTTVMVFAGIARDANSQQILQLDKGNLSGSPDKSEPLTLPGQQTYTVWEFEFFFSLKLWTRGDCVGPRSRQNQKAGQ